jgi:hypothetical protein
MIRRLSLCGLAVASVILAITIVQATSANIPWTAVGVTQPAFTLSDLCREIMQATSDN